MLREAYRLARLIGSREVGLAENSAMLKKGELQFRLSGAQRKKLVQKITKQMSTPVDTPDRWNFNLKENKGKTVLGLTRKGTGVIEFHFSSFTPKDINTVMIRFKGANSKEANANFLKHSRVLFKV